MNKLLLNNDDEINVLVIEEDTELVIRLSNVERNINIIVEKDICLNVIEFSSDTKNYLNVTLNENSRLIYNKIGKNVEDKIKVLLDGAFSSINLHSSVINLKNVKCDFEIIHNNIDTNSYLSNHGVNASFEQMAFNVDCKINKCADSAITNQENKIINTNCGKSIILPNLIVDNDDVSASHSAYISDFDEEIIFYLKSRGISEENSRELLMNGFLLGNLEGIDEYIDEIKEFLKI